MGLQYKRYLPNVPAYKGGRSKDDISKGGTKVYKLSSNENPLGSSPLAIKAIEKSLASLSEYPAPVDARLRNALSSFYGGELSPDQFVTTNSGVANLEFIMRGFLSLGNECIYSSPYFTPYSEFPQKLGAKTINVPLIGNDFRLDISGIADAITDQTSLIFVTSPNNPTGSYLKKEQIDELVAILPDHVLLVFDEVYYQYPDANDYVRALPYVLEGKNVIAVNSFSKAYGLAGLRIGYSYTTTEIATYLRKFSRPFMLNTLSTEAAIEALKDEDFIKKTVSHVHSEKKFLYRELDRMNVDYWKTEANFIMIRPPMSPHDFESKMINSGIMTRTLGGFGSSDCVRVTIGSVEGNRAFIRAMESIYKS